MVGFEKVPTQKQRRQSCDKELVSVHLVAKLHSTCNFPVYLDVVAVHREDLVWHVVQLVDDSSLLLVEHVNSNAQGGCPGVNQIHGLLWSHKVADMQLRVGEEGRVVPQLDLPDRLTFPKDLGAILGSSLPMLHISDGRNTGPVTEAQAEVGKQWSHRLSLPCYPGLRGTLKHASSAMFPILAARHCALVDGGSSDRNMLVKK